MASKVPFQLVVVARDCSSRLVVVGVDVRAIHTMVVLHDISSCQFDKAATIQMLSMVEMAEDPYLVGPSPFSTTNSISHGGSLIKVRYVFEN
nr:hypothetical protein [Tanacetum cinerariifolium]